MKKSTVSLLHACVLIVLAAWGYWASANPSLTAMIPVFIGIILLAFQPGLRKGIKAIRISALILSVLTFIALGKPLWGAIGREDSMAIFRVAIMMLLSVWASIALGRKK